MSSIWAAAGGLLLPGCPSQGYKQWSAEHRHVKFVSVEMRSDVLQCLLLLQSEQKKCLCLQGQLWEKEIVCTGDSSKTDTDVCARVEKQSGGGCCHC